MPEQDPREASIISGEVIKGARSDDNAAYFSTLDRLKLLKGLPNTEFQEGSVVNGRLPHSTQAETGKETSVITLHKQSGKSLTDTLTWRTLTAQRARAKSKKVA